MADLDDGILKIASATKEAATRAHIHHEAGFEDGGAIVRFKFPGLNKGESLQLGFVDREVKESMRAFVMHSIFIEYHLIDHKTGVMNLEIRKRRQMFWYKKEALPGDLDGLLRRNKSSFLGGRQPMAYACADYGRRRDASGVSTARSLLNTVP